MWARSRKLKTTKGRALVYGSVWAGLWGLVGPPSDVLREQLLKACGMGYSSDPEVPATLVSFICNRVTSGLHAPSV